jgi:hypothetical protein
MESTTTMSKHILSMVAMLVCVAGSARADEGISTSTLSDMGLSGLTVVSDHDALAIRGMGFRGGMHSKCNSCGPRGKVSPYSKAYGNSFATIDIKDGGSHSENGYFAEGPYAASGENYSEAASQVTNIEIVDIGGVLKSVTTVCTTKVWAGGSSSSMSF